MRDRRPGRRGLGHSPGDPHRVQREQREHDAEDPHQDEVGLLHVAAHEPLRPLDLADGEGQADADDHQDGEQVLQQPEPPAVADQRQGEVRVHGLAHGLDDRGQKDQEAPEDEGMHQSRQQTLEQLSLAEHHGHFALQPDRHVSRSVHRPAQAHQPVQQAGPAGEESRGRGNERQEDRRRQEHQGASVCGIDGRSLTRARAAP